MSRTGRPGPDGSGSFGPGGRDGGDGRGQISDEELGRRLASLLRARAAAATTTREEAATHAQAARNAAASGGRRIVRRAAVLGLAAVLATAGLGAAFFLARPPRSNPQPTASLQADRSTSSPTPSASPSLTPGPPLTPAPIPTPEPTSAQLTATFHLRPATPASNDIAFADALHGWAAADRAIFATGDGGASWTSAWRGTADVIEIQTSGPSNAWALAQPPRSGGAGPGGLDTDILLATADGGRTWRTIQLRWPLIDLQLVTGREAWALSLATEGPIESMHLLHTIDAGTTWRQVLAGPFGAVCFADAQRGWAVGSNVMRTNDGGAHWVSAGRPPMTASGVLGFSCRDGGLWLIGQRGTGGAAFGGVDYELQRSTDGGSTWTEVLANVAYPRPAGVATGPAQIGPFDAHDASTAIVVGSTADGSAMTTSVTHDGGQTWTATTFELPTMSPIAVAAPDGTHLWIAGDLLAGGSPDTYGLLIASQDGGKTWQERWPTSAPRPLEGLAFVSSATGFGLGTLGDPGAVVRSDDGGRTWRPVGRLSRAPAGVVAGSEPTPTGQTFSFVDPQDGWALDGTGLERTTDGGLSWTTVTLPSEAAKPYALDFRDARNGCLLASDPTDFVHALRTADGGLTWRDAPGAQGSVTACAWGDQGAELLASAQQATGIKTDIDLSGLVIADPEHAWAVSVLDEILRTIDGGSHWQALGWSSSLDPTPLDGGVVALSFPDGQDGWLLTMAGRELQTTDGGLTWTELP